MSDSPLPSDNLSQIESPAQEMPISTDSESKLESQVSGNAHAFLHDSRAIVGRWRVSNRMRRAVVVMALGVVKNAALKTRDRLNAAKLLIQADLVNVKREQQRAYTQSGQTSQQIDLMRLALEQQTAQGLAAAVTSGLSALGQRKTRRKRRPAPAPITSHVVCTPEVTGPFRGPASLPPAVPTHLPTAVDVTEENPLEGTVWG